jgi:uncharacterized membrane protein (DUF4010 family)
MTAQMAIRAIILAALANTLVKAGLVVALGSPPLRRRIVVATALLLVAGVVTLVLV